MATTPARHDGEFRAIKSEWIEYYCTPLKKQLATKLPLTARRTSRPLEVRHEALSSSGRAA